jgi:hypothetical protein
MMDEKFSAASFAKHGLDTDKSRELADLLEQEISEGMRQVVETKFAEIIANLNSMGHNLRLEQESCVGEISYRDDYENGGYHCNLRVAFDYVTSAGYAHLSSSEDT